MVDLLTRPYRNDDAPTLAGLLNLLDLHAGSHGGYTSPEVQTRLVRDLADDTSMLFSPEGHLVAAAVNFSPTLRGNRVDLVGGVHPGWRGKGIGWELLASQLARAQAIHAV